jgi:hypothetical protein
MCPVPLERAVARDPGMIGLFSVAGDSTLFVDTGRRVVNEKLQDNELAQTLFRYDGEKGEYPYLVLVQIWDQRSQTSAARTTRRATSGTTSTGGSSLDLFADDAQVMFPECGVATGRKKIGQLFADVGGTLRSIQHHCSESTWIFSGSDVVVAEGTSHGEHQDGPCRAGVPEWGAGRWCDVFEIRDLLIQRCSSSLARITPVGTRPAVPG